ncbi:hypothetical protein [Aureimonas glaciei]|uniref:Uncharacterized protein n=1 Tax=Aureimonas glaciei TaxID=1776957 RepID=A0A916YF90_9HYPH|nr:hypothetical protein [Aureimonas glaciei]GGD43140.1 hypothetical protein GCM10011335_52270 [Aureimonas glaciei]
MSTDTRTSLTACLDAYCARTKRKTSTVAQAAAGDWRFFDKIEGGNFTLRKFDDVMAWFSMNWPDDLAWPENVKRPQTRVAA